MENKNTKVLHSQSPHITTSKYLVWFSMLYMTIMICNCLLTNRYIKLNENLFVLGGTFTSPIIFILGDIIAETFGYKIAKQIIWSGFASLLVFSVICVIVTHAPYPEFFKEEYIYTKVLGPLLYLTLSSFVAYIIATLFNVYILTKWKALLHGKYFWLRSLGSSTIAEALYSCIAIIMMELNSISLSSLWKVIVLSYLIKLSYSLVFAIPGNVLVYYLKKITLVDEDLKNNECPETS